jgi:hypothetical protein
VQNGVAVLEEMRESREALGLLCRLAYGGSLTEEQQRRLKVQLVDMAKVIPILGIFALPGGMLLLPILARSLPWNILPSAFRKELTRKAPEAENRRPTEDAGDEDGRPPGQSAPDRDSFPPR